MKKPNINISLDWMCLIVGVFMTLYNHSWFSGFFIGGAVFYGLKEQILRLNIKDLKKEGL